MTTNEKAARAAIFITDGTDTPELAIDELARLVEFGDYLHPHESLPVSVGLLRRVNEGIKMAALAREPCHSLDQMSEASASLADAPRVQRGELPQRAVDDGEGDPRPEARPSKRQGGSNAMSKLAILITVMLVAVGAIGLVHLRSTVRKAAYEACASDLRAEHARWVDDPAPEREILPASCGLEKLSDEEFTRAWRAAGGAVWVGRPVAPPG